MKKSSFPSDVHVNFGKKVLSAIPGVFPYVRHRLYMAEVSGIIPKNMFQTNGIIDDAIIELYEKYEGTVDNTQELKLRLFGIVEEKLNLLLKNEGFHKDSVSITDILNTELALLEEKFESDLDSDLLMREELEDISYHQNDLIKPEFVYDDAEKNIIRAFDLKEEKAPVNFTKKNKIHKIYSWLPDEVSNIFDFYVFGKLTYEEIAEIKALEPNEISYTLNMVRKSFRNNL